MFVCTSTTKVLSLLNKKLVVPLTNSIQMVVSKALLSLVNHHILQTILKNERERGDIVKDNYSCVRHSLYIILRMIFYMKCLLEL